jgi:hypothetical protein
MIDNLMRDCLRRRSFAFPLAALMAVLTIAVTVPAHAQKSFGTPDQAAEALVKAAKADDVKAMLSVLGEDGEDIVSSGDPVADDEARNKFVAAYDAKHGIKTEGDKATLIVGQDDFPFPIPIVRQGGSWKYDTVAGREEILARRIGRNELNAIQTCLAYVDAQNEYAEKDHGAGVGVYAQRIVSRPGKKDGLYWPASDAGDESPLGEFAAKAAARGYRVRGGDERQPFHGYYYKILKEQGPRATGGAMDYVVNSKMIGGFALVAWPAEYRNSGVMTFIVNHEGRVYEKDLGPRTDRIASGMRVYNPDNTWKESDTTTIAR